VRLTGYGKLLGAYFRNHPAGTPTATVHIEDTDHHSTTGLSNPWQRVDEWYNYQAPDGAVVGGGGTDFSPRAAGVHVLATVDESTYDEDDGNATDDDHPISWCHRYDGGRSWYVGMGHTQASFTEAPYLKHLLGGLEVAAGAGAGQAIEDGAVLAGCLRGCASADVPAALRRYESLRIDRATRVQRASGERREHHHMPDGPEQVLETRPSVHRTRWATTSGSTGTMLKQICNERA